MNETVLSIQVPMGGSFTVFKNMWEGKALFETLSIVTGLHGDQTNGLQVVAQLTSFLEGVAEKRTGAYRILGKIQLFPAVNVPALETGSRTWPFDGMNLDLAFPGNNIGDPTEKICHAILHHTAESSCVVILENAPLHYDCLTHVRMFDPDRALKKLAKATTLNTGRILKEKEIQKTQLIRYLIDRGIPTFSIVCGRTRDYDFNGFGGIARGLINLMLNMGILRYRAGKPEKGIMKTHGFDEEHHIQADKAGLFLPEVRLGNHVEAGSILGKLQSLRAGNSLEKIIATKSGQVMILRDHPLVYEREPVAVLIGGRESHFWPF